MKPSRAIRLLNFITKESFPNLVTAPDETNNSERASLNVAGGGRLYELLPLTRISVMPRQYEGESVSNDVSARGFGSV
jgi:hypothetical protein